MSKERGVCIHYQYEGCCDLGKECEFWGHCQTCQSWKKKPGAGPARPNLKRKKLERARQKEWQIHIVSQICICGTFDLFNLLSPDLTIIKNYCII